MTPSRWCALSKISESSHFFSISLSYFCPFSQVRVENYSVGVFYRSIQTVIMILFIIQLSYYHTYMSFGTRKYTP